MRCNLSSRVCEHYVYRVINYYQMSTGYSAQLRSLYNPVEEFQGLAKAAVAVAQIEGKFRFD